MNKLIHGIKDFRKNVLPHKREQFAQLAKGQNPDVFFVTCSDSRVAPNWFASTDPGDLFVVRNVGNLIPPASEVADIHKLGNSVVAAAEFSLLGFGVGHIVICGHSECGAMNAIATQTTPSGSSHLKNWLAYAEPSLHRLKSTGAIDPNLSLVNQLSQMNVLQQMDHLKSHAFVGKLVDEGKLEIHGWWFDIAKADIYSFNEAARRFEVIE